MPLSNLQTRDIETVIHPYTNLDAIRHSGPLVIERGRGVRVYDSDGKEYIEAMAGLWCTSLGYSNPELIEAARTQMERLPFAHLFTGKGHDPAIELAERLKEIAPIPVSKVFFANSGSEANDTQIKLVWYMNNALGRSKKKKILSREKAYHGVTIATASLTGLVNNHRDFDLPLPGFLHAPCPHYYRNGLEGESEIEFADRMVSAIEEIIFREGPDTIAAFIAEPIMGAGGVIVPPPTYYEKLRPVLDRHEIFFIDDEVICGFGRLGEMFGSQAMGMQPDSITVAKAITSAYLPLSAVMVPESMYGAMIDESKKIGVFGHGFTYSGHPVSAAVAVKTLEIYQRDDIVGRVRGLSAPFWKHLERIKDHELIGEVRGKGLIAGLEVTQDKKTKRSYEPGRAAGAVVAGCIQEEGVITRAIGDTIAICPPFVITEDEIEELFTKLSRGLDRGLEKLARA